MALRWSPRHISLSHPKICRGKVNSLSARSRPSAIDYWLLAIVCPFLALGYRPLLGRLPRPPNPTPHFPRINARPSAALSGRPRSSPSVDPACQPVFSHASVSVFSNRCRSSRHPRKRPPAGSPCRSRTKAGPPGSSYDKSPQDIECVTSEPCAQVSVTTPLKSRKPYNLINFTKSPPRPARREPRQALRGRAGRRIVPDAQ